MWGQVLVFRMWRWVGCITHIWAWPGRSYVDVEQSCVTELDSCHACHGGEKPREEKSIPKKCCRGISFGNSILDELSNFHLMRGQNIKLFCLLISWMLLVWKIWPLRWMFCPFDTKQIRQSAEYLLHIYNNWPLTGSAVCQSAPHIADHVWLRLRLSPGDHYRKCRSLEVCTRRFDTPMLGTNIEIRAEQRDNAFNAALLTWETPKLRSSWIWSVSIVADILWGHHLHWSGMR